MTRLECVRCRTEIPDGILRRCPKCGSSETRPRRRRIGGSGRGAGRGRVVVIAVVIGVAVAALMPAIIESVGDLRDDDEGARAASDVSAPPPLAGDETVETLPTSADQAAACIERWNGPGNGVTRSTLSKMTGLDRPSVDATLAEEAVDVVMAVDAAGACVLHLRLVFLNLDLRYAPPQAGAEWVVRLVSTPPPAGGADLTLHADGTLSTA